MPVHHPHMSFRTLARLIGATFLISTTAYMLGSALIEATLTGAADGAQLAANSGRLVGGVLLQLVNSAAVVVIGVLFYPLLRTRSEPIALGYVGARIIESVLLALGALIALVILAADQEPTAGAAPLLVATGGFTYQIAMIALSLGSLPFCALLFRSRLIPRPLAALGLVGYATLLVGSVLELYGFDMRLLHNLPGGIFELILPLWLLVRGVALAPRSDTQSMEAYASR